MDHNVQVALLKRAAHHVANNTTDVGEQPAPFDPANYCSPQRFVAERDVLFRKFPLVVGFSSQLPAPGTWITHELTGVPLVVTRDRGGQIHAFLNICRHRGAKLVTEPSGQDCKALVCPYHAWSYDLQGHLIGMPQPKCFPNLDRQQSGLIELPCAERHGMIFVVPTPGPALDIDAYLGSYGAELSSLGMGKYVVGANKNVPGQLDWKLMIEANQESYHINFLHRQSASRRYREQCTLFDFSPPHSRSVILHATMGQSPLPPEEQSWRLLEHADLVYFIFPNTLALWAGGGVQVLSAFPTELGRSVMQGARLVPVEATLTREGRDFTAAFYGNYWVTIGEDIRVSETIQQNALCGLGAQLNLGRNEVLIRGFHEGVQRALSRELTTRSLRAQVD